MVYLTIISVLTLSVRTLAHLQGQFASLLLRVPLTDSDLPA